MNRFLLLLLLPLFSLCGEETPYKIGRDPFWTPFELGHETYNVTAFTSGVMREVEKMENHPFDLIDTDPQSLFSRLCDGAFDAVLTVLTPDKINSDKFDFSPPLMRLGPVLVVRQEASEKSLASLKGKKVGVSSYDHSVQVAQKVPTLIIQPYDNMVVALDDLVAGKIDGVLLSSMKARALVPHRYASTLRIATAPLNEEAIRLVTLKGKGKTLHTLFAKGVKKLKKSGHYRLLRLEYGVN